MSDNHVSFNETVIGIIVMEVWQRKTELPVNRNAVAETSEAGDVTRPTSWYEALCAPLKGWFCTELMELLKLFIPICLTLVFTQVIFIVSLVFVGQIGPLDTVAAGLSVSIINITGISVAYGLSTAIDNPLFPGLWKSKLQEGWNNFSTRSCHHRTMHDPCVIRLTAQYIRIFSSALPGVFLVILLAKYLQSQSILAVFILVGLISNILSVALHAAFIFGAKMGYTGAIAAMTISQGVSPIFVLIYMWSCGLHRKTWGGWSWECMMDWWPFIKLAIPGLLMVGFEWWSYEIGGLVVGTISKSEQGIHYIILNINTVLFSSALATGISASIRVGNELGAGNAIQAKRVFHMTIFITLCEVTFLAVGLHTLKLQIGKIFTKDQLLLHKCSNMMDLLAFFIYFDHLQGALGGVLRGSGRQFLGAVVNFISFYVIGLPLGITLALWMEMGTRGIWWGLLCGALTETIVFVTVLLRTDWDKQANVAIKTARSHPLRPVKKEDEEEPLQQTFELHEKHLEPGYHVGTVATLGEVTVEMDTVQGKVAVVNSDEEEVVIVEKGGVSAQDKHSGVASSDEEEVILEKKSSMEDVLPSPLPLPPPPPTVEDEDEEAVNKDGEKETFIVSEQGRRGDTSAGKSWAVYQYSKTKLLLSKAPFMVAAVAILVVGIVASTQPYVQPLTKSLQCNDTSIYEL
eukprot:Em0008g47a